MASTSHDEGGGGHEGVGAAFLQQCQAGALRARNGMDRERRDPGQQVLQSQPVRSQPRQTGKAFAQIEVLGGAFGLGLQAHIVRLGIGQVVSAHVLAIQSPVTPLTASLAILVA